MKRIQAFGISLLWIGSLLFAASAQADDGAGSEAIGAGSSQVIVDYRGKLQDQDAEPIAGLFDLEFKLYADQNAAEPAWSERHFVSVVDGQYVAPLGSNEPLERSDIPAEAWIGVELVGEGELLRDRFQLGSSGDAGSQAPQAEAFEVSEETRELLEEASDGDRIAYADIAERAVRADRADKAARADRIGDLSVDDIERKAEVAIDKLGEHIADPDAHEATGGLRLGDEEEVTERAGGTGGNRKQIRCPDGYVVVGIDVNAGRMVDGLRVICRKLR